ncbi:MAG: membrane lipoprotein lipid attachment site-containing protein [Bacteroidaceae bacterium]|nr:membrane lipoprotein lipid attachment site-containing protein [Bacteroidaceae bacterium]
MKKIFLTLSAALILVGCNKLSQAKAYVETVDSLMNTADSIHEEGEADDSEMLGLAQYEVQEFDLSELPSSAEEQDRVFNHVLYVNVEEEPNEDDPVGVYTVWVADERWDNLRRVITTNPTAVAPWDQMSGKNADGVAVPMHLIAVASSAQYASEDLSKIVVEGCPDGRNMWTYIIDLIKRTAIQLPSTEGVQEIDMDKGEIIAASYGYYPEGGRYTVNKAYSLEGKFLRQTSDPQPE